MCTELWNVIAKLCHLGFYRSKGCVFGQMSFCICVPGVRSPRTVPSKRLLESFCVSSNDSLWKNTINFRFKLKWQRVHPLLLKTARPVSVSFRCASYFIYQSSSFLLLTNQSKISFLLCAIFIMLHLHFLIFSLLFLDTVKQGCTFYTFPLLYASIFSPLHLQTTLLFHYLFSSPSSVSFLFFSICFPLSSPYTPRTVVPAMFPYCLYPYPLPRTPLHLLPFTSFASDLVRQPLSAWLKSSGPTGRAKPWVCFPSERLLFAHSGN